MFPESMNIGVVTGPGYPVVKGKITQTIEDNLPFINLNSFEKVRVRTNYDVGTSVYSRVAHFGLIFCKFGSYKMNSEVITYYYNIG